MKSGRAVGLATVLPRLTQGVGVQPKRSRGRFRWQLAPVGLNCIPAVEGCVWLGVHLGRPGGKEEPRRVLGGT